MSVNAARQEQLRRTLGLRLAVLLETQLSSIALPLHLAVFFDAAM